MRIKILIILIAIIILGVGGFFIYKNVFPFEEKVLKENIPDTFVKEICLKISQSGDFYYCLAVANQNKDFCDELDEPEQKKLCQAMATRDVSYCREIEEKGAKKMCYYELSFLTGEFSYCDEAENPEECYFTFVHRLHWESRSDEIKEEYCEKFNEDSAEGLIFKNCCSAFMNQDLSLCQNNKYCLSYFKQSLSFCDTGFETPEGTFKYKDDCLIDRAMSEKNSSLCAEIKEGELRDLCYGNFSTHINPSLSLCEKIVDELSRNMCYVEYAIYFAQKERACLSSGGTVRTQLCCDSTDDFPFTCTIGACGCAPEHSHEVIICDCGESRCYDRIECIDSEEYLKEKGTLDGPSQSGEEAKEDLGQEEEKIPLSYHIENPPYYREDGFCWGASAIMLMMDQGLIGIESVREAMKSGFGGTPDMFRGFTEFGVMDKVRIAYSKDYIEEFADFYNQHVLVNPDNQVVLLDNQMGALNKLKELISSDILVIADIHYGNHFVVVTGYDEDYIYINDPGYDGGYNEDHGYEGGSYQEHAKVSISQFLKEWSVSEQYKSLSDMEGAIGFPGDWGMIWLQK